MSTINYKINILNDNGDSYDVYHPETNVEQVYDFSRSKWLNQIISDIESNIGDTDVGELNNKLKEEQQEKKEDEKIDE